MDNRAKAKVHSFISGLLSAFDLSGQGRYFIGKGDTRSKPGSMYRHWRRVGEDIECATRTFGPQLEDDAIRKELKEQLRKWNRTGSRYRRCCVAAGSENDEVKELTSS